MAKNTKNAILYFVSAAGGSPKGHESIQPNLYDKSTKFSAKGGYVDWIFVKSSLKWTKYINLLETELLTGLSVIFE